MLAKNCSKVQRLGNCMPVIRICVAIIEDFLLSSDAHTWTVNFFTFQGNNSANQVLTALNDGH